MSAVIWWTGALVWIGLAFVFWWLVFEWFVGLATAASWARWAIRHSDIFQWRKHGPALVWAAVKRSFGIFYAYRNNGNLSITNQGNGAVWRGIGDWT